MCRVSGRLRGLTCKRLQVDEIWSFVYAKAKNVATAKSAPDVAGDVWTWTAIDADTKLIPSFFVGGRDAYAANVFMRDLSDRLVNRVQLTSDGNKAYLDAVEQAFGDDIDYAMLVKHYGPAPEGPQRRYRYQSVKMQYSVMKIDKFTGEMWDCWSPISYTPGCHKVPN